MKLIIQPDDGITPLLLAIKKAKKTIDVVIFRFDRIGTGEGAGGGGWPRRRRACARSRTPTAAARSGCASSRWRFCRPA